ncbi:MAG: O-antigen ligase family protein [Actinobacteria bacterium]|nr:O-antigen ligase family protein [Actinomycetota bacterium]
MKKVKLTTDRLDNLIYYAFHFMVISLPLIFLPFTQEWYGLIKVTLLRIETLFIISCWLIKQLFSDEMEIKRTKIDFFVFVFILLGLISTLLSANPVISFLGKYRRYEGFSVLLNYGLIFFLVNQSIFKIKKINSILTSLVITSAVISMYGILQFVGFDFAGLSRNLWETNRSFSTLGNPVFLGGYLALILPLALAKYFNSGNLRNSIFYGLMIFLIVSCLIATFSRGGWIAGFTGFILMIILAGRDIALALSKKILIILLIFSFALSVFLIYDRFIPSSGKYLSFSKRLVSIPQTDNGWGSRIEVWKAVPKIVLEKPFFGWGPDMFYLAYPRFATLKYAKLVGKSAYPSDNAHNYFLQLISTQGILGFLAFILTIFILLFYGIKFLLKQKNEERILFSGLMAALIGYLIYLQSGINISSNGMIFWLVAGIISNQTIKIPSFSVAPSKAKRSLIVILFILLFFMGSYFSIRLYVADVKFKKAGETDLFMAIAEYKSSIELNPYISQYYYTLGKLYIKLASIERNSLFFSKAKEIYLAGREVNPDDFESYSLMGDLYIKEGLNYNPDSFSYAESELKKSLEIYPYWISSRANLGFYYFLKNQYKKAVDEFNRVLEIDSEDFYTYFYLGKCYEGLGERDKAISAYKSVLNLNPDHKEAAEALERLL